MKIDPITARLRSLIPDDEYHLKMSYGNSELSGDFLGFVDAYAVIADLLPKDMTIIDLGCCQATQCYFFKDFEQYIGVDCYDQQYSPKNYKPPLRFATDNTKHYVMTIQEFLNRYTWTYGYDVDTYFIMSAVPNMPCQILEGNCENYFWWYPGEKPKAQGLMAKEILNAYENLSRKH